MINSKKKLLGTLLALTITGIFFANSSPLLGAPVPGGPGYLMVHASAFIPGMSTTIYRLAGASLYNDTSPSALFYAPVSLPQGATINRFVLFYLDNNDSNIIGRLSRTPHPGNVSSDLATVSSSGASTTPTFAETTGITNPVVDNQSYGYYVWVFIPANTSNNSAVNGFRIDYSFPTNLPLIAK
jgi:hypothetical protein